MSNSLEIKPIDIDEDKFNRVELDPFVFPSCIIGLGKVASGKTTFMANMVRITEPVFKGNVILFAPTLANDPILDKLIEEDQILEYFEDYSNATLRKVLETIGETDSDQKYLIIFDDILGSLPRANSRDSKFFDKFIATYRHGGSFGAKEGQVSLILAEELHPACGDTTEDFMTKYNEAKRKPFDFMLLDFRKMRCYRNLTEKLYDKHESKD